MKKTIFISGANGFIGKNLVEKLQKKFTLLTPNRSELDLLDRNSVNNYFKNNHIDVVIHCAVVGGSRIEEHLGNALSQNLRIFFNIIENKKYFNKLIHLGSGAEYDKTRSLIKIKESDFGKRIPQDDYGLFKYTCSKYLENLDGDICNLRIFGLYGKYEDYRYRFISNAICNNLMGLPITMNQNVYFDYLNIDDFVKIIEYFIVHQSHHTFYNVGTGTKIDILSLAQEINNIAEKKSKIIVKKKGLNKEYTCDNSLLMQELGEFTFEDYKDGIAKLYQWYKNKKHLISL